MSRIEILRGLVIEKMTVAVQEILAVVETTVAGYENEVLLLKRELDHHKSQLHAVLQPQVNLYRIDFDGAGTTDIMHSHSTDECELRREHKDTENSDYGVLEKCTGENRVDGVATKVSHEERLLEHEESDSTLADRPSDDSVTCPTHREERLREDKINNVQNTKVKRKRQLPERYRSTHNVTHRDNCDIKKNKEWKPNKDKKLRSSNVKKKHQMKLRISLLKNCPKTDLSNNAVTPDSPVQTIMCHQHISESDFINQLRSTFPELVENKPFEAYLVDSTRTSVPILTNRMTHNELYKTFRSHEQKQFDFYIQLKQKDTCDTLMNIAATTLDDQPTTSGLEEEMPSETGVTSELTNQQDNMFCKDSPAQSEDAEDNDEWKPEQNSEDEERGAAPKSEKKMRKQRERKFYSGSCKLCGSLFRSEALLIKHALSHLDHPKCMCGVCGQQLESSEELKTHLETHQKLHQCDACGRYFLTFVAFQKHVATHKLEKPFKCNICQNVFASDELLKQHQLHHNNDKPYKCDNCPQSFKFKAQYQEHSRKHTGEKPYCCDICGKFLADYQSLCRHKLIHTGEKNYSCQQCGKLFYTVTFLKQHEIIHTVREKKYLCDVCSKAFYTKNELRNHQRTHDKSHIIKCPVCDKLIKRNLKSHMLTHTGEKTYSCKECGNKYRHRHHLKDHMNKHLGLKPLTCTVCGYTCARKHHLDSHMRTHTGHKPYKCTLCDKAFTQSHCLKTHLKNHQTEDQSAAKKALKY